MKTLVIVDVQPFYARWIDFDIEDLIDYMSKYDEVIIFFNGADIMCDELYDVQSFFFEHGMSETTLDTITWVEKTYGFLRNWMDNYEVDDEDIITVLHRMLANDVCDSRDLDESYLEQNGFPIDDPIFFPDFDCNLKQDYVWICGGGKEECLREIELYLESIGITTDRVDCFTY